ncbi:hypothetical protein KUH32_10680 [Thalassococcus sp. CAU 1522]|uniref:Uncharacterized protein n=1 Tax=Thalassococcus arenae TaxID=2851652 RepID=A0ABS6N894_9RHOB|nr:hypothetical protein [Thalassococcus arenae]MBV2360241.1 hypothetical protein [Thalassococcus arenae]
MPHHVLPTATDEVLAIPSQDVPDTIRHLLRNRAMSSLVERIHGDLRSSDPARRDRGAQALAHLGFAD